jgi:hypothetical protein
MTMAAIVVFPAELNPVSHKTAADGPLPAALVPKTSVFVEASRNIPQASRSTKVIFW